MQMLSYSESNAPPQIQFNCYCFKNTFSPLSQNHQYLREACYDSVKYQEINPSADIQALEFQFFLNLKLSSQKKETIILDSNISFSKLEILWSKILKVILIGLIRLGTPSPTDPPSLLSSIESPTSRKLCFDCLKRSARSLEPMLTRWLWGDQGQEKQLVP